MEASSLSLWIDWPSLYDSGIVLISTYHCHAIVEYEWWLSPALLAGSFVAPRSELSRASDFGSELATMSWRDFVRLPRSKEQVVSGPKECSIARLFVT